MVTIRSISLLSAMTFILTTVLSAPAQKLVDVKEDIVFLRDSPVLADDDSTAERKEPLLPDDEVSDLRILSHLTIRAYQTLISSQQHNVCVFTPSCSHFGMESVRRAGFVAGVLQTADRLTRCNPFVSQGGYVFDRAVRKYADPVSACCGDAADTISCTSSCGRSLP